MPDLILTIAPGHDVRCFLPPDQPDPLLAGFRIFDFLEAVAHLPNAHRNKDDGFPNQHWKAMQKENSVEFAAFNALVFDADIKALNIDRRKKHKATTAHGLVLLLAIVKQRLSVQQSPVNLIPLDAQLPRQDLPDPSSHDYMYLPEAEKVKIKLELTRRNEEDCRRFLVYKANEEIQKQNQKILQHKPKIDTQLISVVTDTLQRFIGGDHSMLREYDPDKKTQKKDLHQKNAQGNVFFRCMDRVVMGVYHPQLQELVFSVYDCIDLGRNHGTRRQRHFYVHKMWDDMKRKIHPSVVRSVNASILRGPTSTIPVFQPALRMSDLYDLFSYVVDDAADKAYRASCDKPYKGMHMNRPYTPVKQNIRKAISDIFKRFQKGDDSFIENI